MSRALYRHRREAGRALAGCLQAYGGNPDLLVLALPRGGVPVAFEVAQALGAPLDLLVVRKLGLPGQPEYAMGAIAQDVQVLDQALLRQLQVAPAALQQVLHAERQELARRAQAYRAGRPPLALQGRTVVLIDDGLATGASMRAAVQAVRALQAAHCVVAVPVGAADSCAALRAEADAVVCAATPEPFRSVGQWYEDFTQTGDGEVRQLLEQAWRGEAGA